MKKRKRKRKRKEGGIEIGRGRTIEARESAEGRSKFG